MYTNRPANLTRIRESILTTILVTFGYENQFPPLNCIQTDSVSIEVDSRKLKRIATLRKVIKVLGITRSPKLSPTRKDKHSLGLQRQSSLWLDLVQAYQERSDLVLSSFGLQSCSSTQGLSQRPVHPSFSTGSFNSGRVKNS